jgi:hypothetical protein
MITNRRSKINFEKVICDVERNTITIRAVRNKKQAAEAIKKRCAEIRGMLALRSDLTGEEQEKLEAELDLLKDFNTPTFVTAREEAPAWSSAEDLIFDKGLQEAREKARQECERVLKRHQMAKSAGTPDDAASLLDTLKSLREQSFFEFLARFCETFPEYKKQLRYDVARRYCDGPAARSEMISALQKQPLCKPETLRFLRAYLEGDDPLWKVPLSECARRMGWFTKENKPDHARVREILREYGIKHGMKGKPGRPKKIGRMKF